MDCIADFIRFDKPFLDGVAGRLAELYENDSLLDLERVSVVVPTQRAGRILLSKLVEVAEGHGAVFTPPRIYTVGHLPELLYVPDTVTASDLDEQVALANVLFEHPDIVALLGSPALGEAAMSTGLAIAGEFQTLFRELLASGRSMRDIAEDVAAYAPNDAQRWNALADLAELAEAALQSDGVASLAQARLWGLAAPPATPLHGDIVLAGVIDMPDIALRHLEHAQGTVRSIVWAEDAERDADQPNGFGYFGELDIDYWAKATIDIPQDALLIADRPDDMVHAAACHILSLPPEHDASAVGLALGDETVAGLVRRALDLHGLKARLPHVGKVSQSPPALLLNAIADYAARPTPKRMRILALHPDVTGWLATLDGGLAERAPSVLDRYRASHIDHDSGGLGTSFDGGVQRDVKRLSSILERSILGRLRVPPTLPDAAKAIGDVLSEIYEHHMIRPGVQDDDLLAQSLEAIATALQELTSCALTPKMPVSTALAIRLVLQLVGDQPLSDPSDGHVEVFGWLEAPLDPSQVLIVLGFNQGVIPGAITPHPFLNEFLREALGMPTFRRRFARDAYAVHAILASRHALFVAGRRSADGEPLLPSRLTLTGDAENVAKMVLRFYPDKGGASQPAYDVPQNHGVEDLLGTIPLPDENVPLPEQLHVTAFKEYLACPYRFYLKFVLHLNSVDEIEDEMPASLYGTLLHDAMRRFGDGAAAKANTEDAVFAGMRDALRSSANDRFGPHLMPAVEIQLAQLERRLRMAARVQAGHARNGWEIHSTEQRVSMRFPDRVQGPFTLVGKIDRIDHNVATGEWMVIDYKTHQYDSLDRAYRKGRGGDKTWIDLQLPLYVELAKANLAIDGNIRPTLFVIPSDLNKTTMLVSDWTDDVLESAWDTAHAIADKIAGREFWPPAERPPAFDDGLGAICLDGAASHAQILERSEKLCAATPLHMQPSGSPDIDFDHEDNGDEADEEVDE